MIVWDPIAPGENLLNSVNWATRLASGDTISSSIWGAVTLSPLYTTTYSGAMPTATPAPTVGLLTNVFITGLTTAMLGVVFNIKNTIGTGTAQTEYETAQFICSLK